MRRQKADGGIGYGQAAINELLLINTAGGHDDGAEVLCITPQFCADGRLNFVVAKIDICTDDYADNCSGKAPNLVLDAHSSLSVSLWRVISLRPVVLQCALYLMMQEYEAGKQTNNKLWL